jgi:hypothetical protein
MRGFYRNAEKVCEKSAQVVIWLNHWCPHFRKPAYIGKSAGNIRNCRRAASVKGREAEAAKRSDQADVGLRGGA